jgi:YD repeat-containing protein
VREPGEIASEIAPDFSTNDHAHQIPTVTDSLGNVTTYQYDLNNRKIMEMQPSVAGSSAVQRVTYFFYDQADHLVREVTKSATGGQDRTIIYEFDPLDRMVHKVIQREGATGPIVEDDSTFSYESQLDSSLLKTAVNGVANLGFANEAAPPFADHHR